VSKGSHADDGAAERTAVTASAAVSEVFARRCDLAEMTQTTLVSETARRPEVTRTLGAVVAFTVSNPHDGGCP
jgi:hypothetical protein